MTWLLNSPSHLLWASWALYLLALAGFLAGLYFASWPIWIALKRTRPMRSDYSAKGLTTWNRVLAHLFIMQKMSNRGAGIFVVIFGLSCFGLGYVVGWQGRIVAQASTTDTWTNVHILTQHAPNNFTATVDDNPETVTFKLCADSTYAQFQPGSRLKFMTFERRPSCLSFAGPQLGFRSLWDENGKPIITEANYARP